MRRVLLALAVLAAGCTGGVDRRADSPPPPLAIYHLEQQVRGPVDARGAGTITCGPPAPVCPNVSGPPRRTYVYAVRGEARIAGEHLDAASVRQDRDPQTGAPVVLARFDEEGARRFESLTRELARVGLRLRREQHLAIVVDGKLVSFPALPYLEFPAGLAGENGMQVGVASEELARELVKTLRR